MTCVTCHDPHDIPRGDASGPALRRCLPELPQDGARRRRAAGRRRRTSATCIDCHMPQRRTEDAVHVVDDGPLHPARRPARDLTAPLEEADDPGRQATIGARSALDYPSALPPTPETELYLALAQVQQGSNLAAGIPRLQKAIEGHGPAPAEFYYELARAHAKTGNQAEVIRWSEAALSRDAAFAPALKELAGAATALGQWDRAIEALRRAVTLRPSDSHALADLGNVYLQRQQVRRSRGRPSSAPWRSTPACRARTTRLGLAALAQGDRGRAEQQFREAIRIQPDLAEAHSNLANLLAGRRAYAEAAAHFEQALRADPNHVAAHHGYGLVLALTQQNARRGGGAAHRGPAGAEPASGPHGHRRRPGRRGKYSRGAGGVRGWRSGGPDDFDAHFGLAELLLRQGRTAQAIPHLRAAATSPDPALSEAAERVYPRCGRTESRQSAWMTPDSA